MTRFDHISAPSLTMGPRRPLPPLFRILTRRLAPISSPLTSSVRRITTTAAPRYQHVLYLGSVLGYTSIDRLSKFPRSWLDSVGVSSDVDHGLRFTCAAAGPHHLLLGYELLETPLHPGSRRARRSSEELVTGAETNDADHTVDEGQGEVLDDPQGTTSTSSHPSKVFALGRNTHAQLGLGFSSQEATRGMVTGTLSGAAGITNVVAGNGFSYVVTSDTPTESRIFGFGNDTLGQLGASPDGVTHNQIDPYDVSTRLEGSDAPQLRLLPLPKEVQVDGWRARSMSAGLDHALVLLERVVNGYRLQEVRSTGLNTDGQLGLTPASKQDSVPIEPLLSRTLTTVPLPSSGLTEVVCGADTSYALTEQGDVWAWGNSEYGQSLAGVHDRITTPTLVPNPLPTAYREEGLEYDSDVPRIHKLVAGGSFSALLDTQGRVWVVGYGPRGSPPTDDTKEWEKLTLIPLPPVQNLFAGVEYMVATTTDAEVWLWGIPPRTLSTHPIITPTRISYTIPKTPLQAWLDENPRLKQKANAAQQQHNQEDAGTKQHSEQARARVSVQAAACTRDHLVVVLNDGMGRDVWAECDQPPKDKGTDVTV